MKQTAFCSILFIVFSCKSEEEKLYDQMAARFCECYGQDTTAVGHKDYMKCVDLTIAHFSRELSEVGFNSKDLKTFDKIVNQGFLSGERVEKYCPILKSDVRKEFKRQADLAGVKKVFTGRFSRQYQAVGKGKSIYVIDLKDEKDSIHQFLSTDSVSVELQHGFIEIHYHNFNESQKFVDSIVMK